MVDYKRKYQKYKKKYALVKNIKGGSAQPSNTWMENEGNYQSGCPQMYGQQSMMVPPQIDYSSVNYHQGYADGYNNGFQHGINQSSQQMHVSTGSSNRQTTVLREKLEASIKENDELKQHCAYSGWDSKKGLQKSPFTKNIERKLFFKPSGPFIYNRKTRLKEDQITEFKQYDVYSNYNPPNKRTYPGDGIKDLHYTDGSQTTGSLRFILRKTFVGFLNTTGGRLFLGIADNGVSVGIPNVHTRDHIDHLEQKISQEVFNKIVPKPPADNIIFIWHWVYHHENYEPTENGSKDYWILEIQIGPGSRDLFYESPKDVIKDEKDKAQTIWFRQASATISVSKSQAESFIEQNKLSCARELLEPLENESGLKSSELKEIEKLEEEPEVVLEKISDKIGIKPVYK